MNIRILCHGDVYLWMSYVSVPSHRLDDVLVSTLWSEQRKKKKLRCDSIASIRILEEFSADIENVSKELGVLAVVSLKDTNGSWRIM